MANIIIIAPKMVFAGTAVFSNSAHFNFPLATSCQVQMYDPVHGSSTSLTGVVNNINQYSGIAEFDPMTSATKWYEFDTSNSSIMMFPHADIHYRFWTFGEFRKVIEDNAQGTVLIQEEGGSWKMVASVEDVSTVRAVYEQAHLGKQFDFPIPNDVPHRDYLGNIEFWLKQQKFAGRYRMTSSSNNVYLLFEKNEDAVMSKLFLHDKDNIMAILIDEESNGLPEIL